MISRIIVCITFVLAYTSNTHAEEAEGAAKLPARQLLIQLDNDLFAGSDRDYTNGVRIGFVREIPADSPRGRSLNDRFRKRADKPQNYIPTLGLKNKEDFRFTSGLGITQLMFTPDDPFALDAPEGERPYAGWLGLELSLHIKEKDYANSLTLSLGTTGESSLAQPAQNWVHRNVSNSPLFQGWGSQVPSELTVNLHFDHKRRFRKISKLTAAGLELDGYYEGGLALGNFRTDAYIGALVRIGYRLPSSVSTPRVQLGSYGHQLFSDADKHGKKFSAFGFAGVRATGVLHDITLDGPVFRKFDTGAESKPLVSELLYGGGIRYYKAELIYSQTVRSDEFVGQTENQTFGSVMARWQWNFK